MITSLGRKEAGLSKGSQVNQSSELMDISFFAFKSSRVHSTKSSHSSFPSLPSADLKTIEKGPEKSKYYDFGQ